MAGISPGISPPAMPRPQLDTPAVALVAATRQRYEAAKEEVRVKAETAARYYTAWEDSKRRLGPRGDPGLKRTAEVEMEFFRRQVEAIVRPAASAYAEALQDAFQAGGASFGGRFPPEEGVRRLLEIEAEGISAGYDSTIDPAGMAAILDRIAQSSARLWDRERDTRALKLGIMCVELAPVFGAEQMSGVLDMARSIELGVG